MSQISPPIRIVLVVVLAFLAVWMVALRPKDEAPAPEPVAAPAGNVQTGAPAQSAPGAAVQAAQGAAAATEAAQAARSGEAAAGAAATQQPATDSASAPRATAAGAKKAVAEAGLPLPVMKAIAKDKVLVLLFWNPKAADDRAVRSALADVGSHGGKVFKRTADIKTVARYAAITRGVNLSQSPTVVVVDRRLGATALAGYSDRGAIAQLVDDALRVPLK